MEKHDDKPINYQKVIENAEMEFEGIVNKDGSLKLLGLV